MTNEIITVKSVLSTDCIITFANGVSELNIYNEYCVFYGNAIKIFQDNKLTLHCRFKSAPFYLNTITKQVWESFEDKVIQYATLHPECFVDVAILPLKIQV